MCVRVQNFTLISNFISVVPECSAASGVTFKAPVLVEAARQSNDYDCGCHAIMNMRVLARTAVLEALDWHSMVLPTGKDADRDERWRAQIAAECLARTVSLTSGTDASE